jgi:hypothetical protein
MTLLLNPRVWLAFGLAVLLAVVGFTSYRSGKATVRAEWNRERATLAELARKVEANARTEEQRRTEAAERIAHEADQALARARADAAAAVAAAGGLRNRIAALTAAGRTAAHSGTDAGREAASDAIGVFANVLGQADRMAGEYAAFADQAHAAGTACQRQYESLTN